MDCTLFQNQIIEDPVTPTVLRRNYGNDPECDGEVLLTDNANKENGVLCVVDSEEIKNIDDCPCSTARQQAPYPNGSGEQYKNIYHDEKNYRIGNINISDRTGTAAEGGNGTGVNGRVENEDLGWIDRITTPFANLDSNDINYSNGWSISEPVDIGSIEIDTVSLSTSLVTYWSKIVIGTNTSVGSWATGDQTPPDTNTFGFATGGIAADINEKLVAIPATIFTQEANCEAIKTILEDRNIMYWVITETDIDAGIEVGSVTYELGLVEIT